MVATARALASERGFAKSSSAATGRLLRALAASCGSETIIELGTGAGVGAAWLASGKPRGCDLVTYEVDEELAAAVADLFASSDGVVVRNADWRDEAWPIPELVFVDAPTGKYEDRDQVVARLPAGAMVVLDDFSPLADWMARTGKSGDEVRDWWLEHPDLVATEVGTAEREVAVIAVRR